MMINGSVAKQMVPRPVSGSNVVAVIDGLTAGYQYQFSVKSVVLDVASAEVQVNATTSELFDRNSFFALFLFSNAWTLEIDFIIL